MMNVKRKFCLIPLILVGLSVLMVSCLTAPTPTQTNTFFERTSTAPIPTQTSASAERASTAPTPTQTNIYTEGARGFDPLILRIRVDHPEKPCLKGGELLEINFTVTNEGQNRRLEVLESKDRPVMDIVIQESPSMKSVYSWAEQNPGQIQHRVEWQPGESKTINVKWQLPQKEYAHQNLHIAGSVHVDDVSYGASAVVTLCLGSPPRDDLLRIRPTIT
jgi:hypothetical protein